MPTQSTIYNSRVTDESLEKRFRDTFKSQGGAELVDDLYAQGVIVPIVDFTAAATGQQLAENLQTAWDFSTGQSITAVNSRSTVVSTAGFWKVQVNAIWSTANVPNFFVGINDGTTDKNILGIQEAFTSTITGGNGQWNVVVFLRSGDSLFADTTGGGGSSQVNLFVTYRQIATVNGDLVNPTGFTSS
jgi:hypothetical protein